LIKEHKHVQKLRSHGLSPRKKLLLVGPPGTGKTMTASILAGELGLPLFIVRLESLMTKFMGETAGKLRLIFDAIEQTRGVYLFDEFDSIGSQRGNANDVGEIRRVLNSFLQMIEQDGSDSLLIAAIKSKLVTYKTSRIVWSKAVEAAETLSYGDITRACEDAIKDAIIHNKEAVSHTDLVHSIKERRLVRQKQQITF
jgi:ATP-dependent 26S proteasome regulatory subunit